MKTNHRGLYVTLTLLVGAPVLTLVATGYQMVGVGGEGLIRPAQVSVPPPAQPAAARAPDSKGNQAGAASGTAQRGASSQAATGAPPVPGRSALDFSARIEPWEAFLKSGDPRRGETLAASGRPEGGVQACVACHGAAGIAPAGTAFPNLSGLTSEYVAKQLDDYREGRRTHPLMAAIAKGLTEQELGDVALYYGQLPRASVVPVATRDDIARTLDVHGENERALPACANCHGIRGSGEGALLPRLAGQPARYFLDQMEAFRSGQRHNDDVGVMRAFAQRLTSEELEALAGYYEQAVKR